MAVRPPVLRAGEQSHDTPVNLVGTFSQISRSCKTHSHELHPYLAGDSSGLNTTDFTFEQALPCRRRKRSFAPAASRLISLGLTSPSLSGRDRNKYLETSPPKAAVTLKRIGRVDELQTQKDPVTGELWIMQHASSRLHNPLSVEEALVTELAHSFESSPVSINVGKPLRFTLVTPQNIASVHGLPMYQDMSVKTRP